MFPTGQVAVVSSISTSSFPEATPSRWEAHQHDYNELLWGVRGTLTVETPLGLNVVPAMMGLWIPAGLSHGVQAWNGTTFHCSFIDVSDSPFDTERPSAVSVPVAARELLLYMRSEAMNPAARSRSEQVIADLLSPLPDGPPALPMPSDDRLLRIAAALLQDPARETSLEEWGNEVGASARNLSRLFAAQTHITFEQWRIQLRIRLAMGLLATGMPISSVARKVGYRTASAFVQSFRRVLGFTPGHYANTVASDTQHSLSGVTTNPPL